MTTSLQIENPAYNESLQHIVRRIIELAHPLKIILFGSVARGQASATSDIDLLIVMPDGTHKRKTAQHLYRYISGAKVPFDLLVTTPSDLEKHANNIGLIYRTVLQEGREIYARP